jgi:hypothetical protein
VWSASAVATLRAMNGFALYLAFLIPPLVLGFAIQH